MLGGSKATNEQSSSVCDGTGYKKVYPSGHRPKEGLTWSLERELSAHSPDDEEEEDYKANEGEEDEGEVEEEREDEEEESD